ncbi:MAG: hypothetical protein AAGF23_25820 [Acidobacteriota bacterium]
MTELSTVKEVMDSIIDNALVPGFNYKSDGDIVDAIRYEFGDSSETPPNAKGRPANGLRELENSLGGQPILIWQYYRGATYSFNGENIVVRNRTQGQPPFSTEAIGKGLPDFEGAELQTVNLIWRIVQIQMTPERQAKFLRAKMDASFR